MNSVTISMVVVPAVVAFLLFLVCTFLYEQTRQDYFRAWQLGWGAYSLHYVLDAWSTFRNPSAVISLAASLLLAAPAAAGAATITVSGLPTGVAISPSTLSATPGTALPLTFSSSRTMKTTFIRLEAGRACAPAASQAAASAATRKTNAARRTRRTYGGFVELRLSRGYCKVVTYTLRSRGPSNSQKKMPW